MNTHAGATGWYIAGGMAAFLRIDAYANKDAGYYAGVRNSIAPADIEIGVLDSKAGTLTERYGQMTVVYNGAELHVDMQPQSAVHLALQIDKCSTVGGMNVYSAGNLVSAYNMSSNPLKADKRRLRVAMLKLIGTGREINLQNVQALAAAPTLGAQIAARRIE